MSRKYELKEEVWISLQQKRPPLYELVIVELERGGEFPAWWTGAVWDGSKLLDDDIVTRWKKHKPHTVYLKTDTGDG